ncbi:hypothetical protein [Marinifilum caeruleilacunae]|uniref:DUF2225 domain-containing protein n=1 Tax=Marinifilum caeruleilacunae TaxID=2499076 RepID=A0ABX1WXD8_9BACT|nr:hypothetical protein [Marinifilum caeruleilacunae]NOU60586.1 hypothetical protein [Marinifilum caeruleilacunae]
MMFGGTEISSCPQCGKWIKRQTYGSMNTFGATIWSDNYIVGSMYINSLEVAICAHCEKCILTKDLISEAYIPSVLEMYDEDMMGNKVHKTDPSILEDKYQDAKALFLPGFNSLKEALNYIGEGEIVVRHNIWQHLNHRFRKKKIKNLSKENEQFYINNVKKLIDLIKIENDNDQIRLAELYRNIGDFESSREHLQRVEKEELKKLRPKFENEIEKGNRNTFILHDNR